MVSAKKREVADENHMSLSKWDEEPCFVCVLKMWSPMQWKNLDCKEYNLKRHSETNHISQLSSLQGQQRKDKINQPKKVLLNTKICLKVQCYGLKL